MYQGIVVFYNNHVRGTCFIKGLAALALVSAMGCGPITPEETALGYDSSAQAEILATGCDKDGDGYLAPECGGNDCNDNSAWIYPGAPERCDSLDNDCNRRVDDNCFYSIDAPDPCTKISCRWP